MNWGQNAWLASGGAWIGFFSWGTSTQLNYSLVPWECDTGIHLTPWLALGLAALAVAGSAVSLQSFRHRSQRLGTQTPVAGTPFEMLAVVGMAAGVLFALIVALQGGAALIVPRCVP
jgi:hypothetical protein